ncbi:MAG: M23 family metallopeptidase [Silvanigrellaceae bacterium]
MSGRLMHSQKPHVSKPPQVNVGKSGWFARLACVTFIYIPNESATSRRFRVPKVFLHVGLVLFFAMIGLVSALSANLVKMAALQGEYEKLRAENVAIRSEAAALISKLQEVKTNLVQVDHISDQVRQEAASLDPRAEKKKLGVSGLNFRAKSRIKNDLANPSENSVVLKPNAAARDNQNQDDTKIDFPTQAVGSNVNTDNLEFRDLFAALTDIRDKSSTQLQGLSTLLKELQGYRVRLSQTPTISPVQGFVTSFYGKRSSPFTGEAKMHQGVDIAAPMGSPIRAAANGTVIRAGTADDYGNFIEIAHGFGVTTRYAHASRLLVKTGTRVSKGDLIGLVGATGRTTGPHLHYEVEVGGRRVDPSNFIRGL